MPDPAQGPRPVQHKQKSFFERLTAFIFREPESREELLEALHEAHERDLLDADAMSMIEGVLQVSELRAADLMVPRSQMEVIDISEPPHAWLPHLIATGHSRFPVIEGDRDSVIGILLAKDLLRLYTESDYQLRDNIHPAVFIPESKPINVLLRDFRANHNHMAIVVDEYGGVAGLITIEDVLEQIVGEIDDEFDTDKDADNILVEREGRWRVKALTEIGQFNQYFGTTLSDDHYDTIGGLITEQLGHVPHRSEVIAMAGLHFTVLRADARQAELFQVERPAIEPKAES
ncbi:MAG: transporter associated domain-containing protein [Burkholderiaceae bacterium]